MVDATSKNQLHVVRASEIEVLTDHFLEEHAPLGGAIEHLGQGEFGLQD